MDTNGKVQIPDLSIFEPEGKEENDGLVSIDVKFLGADAYFKAWFEDTDKQSEQEYRKIANNNFRGKGVKSKSLDDAMLYLFKKKFHHTNIDWNIYKKDEQGEFTDEITGNRLKELGLENEKDYFIKNKTGERYIRPMMDEYYRLVLPETTTVKD